jgi:hypothetical protein
MSSFVQQGHDYHLYVYERPAGVPPGVQLRDAAEIVPSSTVFVNRRGRGKGSYACFADLFRYKLLCLRGGWWVDADVFCLRPFDFDAPYVLGAEDKPVANGVIKAPAGCELMRRCSEEAANYDPRNVIWNELGDVLARAVHDLGLMHYVRPPHVFSPIPFYEVVDHVRGRKRFAISSESYAVHLYHEMWRRKRLNKFGRFPDDSVFEQLRRRAGMPMPPLPGPHWLSWLRQIPHKLLG